MAQLLEVETRGNVRQIRMARPHKKNALNRELVLRTAEALRDVAKTREVHAVILAGAGGAFSAGGDLEELVSVGAAARDRLLEFHELILAVVECPVPVVVAWQGAAAGFGADLALAGDLRVGDESAFLQASFVHVSLVPDGGGTYFLPELLGRGRAFEWLAFGERVAAEQLLRAGVLNRLFPAPEFEREVDRFVGMLAQRAPLALRALKSQLNEERRPKLLAALGSSAQHQLELLESDDFREGVAAFREKRAARFVGR